MVILDQWFQPEDSMNKANREAWKSHRKRAKKLKEKRKAERAAAGTTNR